MANEQEDMIIKDFARDIAGRVSEAAVLARAADELGRQGMTERAFKALLDLEPLLHDAKTLILATAVVRRRDSARPG